MKQAIAVDIDDVLANENDGMRRFINRRYGTGHSARDYDITSPYWGYWEKVWGVDETEGAARYEAFLAAKVAEEVVFDVLPGSTDTLRLLKDRGYELAVLTKRRPVLQEVTHRWLEQHYPETFSGVHFVDLWKADEQVTKAAICREIGAGYLIDDSAEHCSLADEAGVQALLFGDYGWNRAEKLPNSIVRVRDWAAVAEYFDAQRTA